MNIKSLSFLKIIFFFVFIIFGFNSFLKGLNDLNNFNKNISFVKTAETKKNDFVDEEKIKKIDIKKIDNKQSPPIKEEKLKEELIIVKKMTLFQKLLILILIKNKKI